jgi:DNA-binding transcriptional ArsR family regulator
LPTNEPIPSPHWTFLTNHGHVLICLARDADARLRDVSRDVGITERAVQGIVADLEAAGYLTRERVGRRNRYRLRPDVPLRHPVERDHLVGELLAVLEPRATQSDVSQRDGPVAASLPISGGPRVEPRARRRAGGNAGLPRPSNG